MSKSDLEKYVEFGLSGSLEIKGDEKRYWLGEFRERVVFALTYEQVFRREAMKIADEILEDPRIDKVVVHSGVSEAVSGKYMDLAKKHNKDFKLIDMQNDKQFIALVMASKEAVNEEKVLIEKLPILPDKFYQSKNKKLCKEHMEELQREAPMFNDEFEEVTFFDKMVGITCQVCDDDPKKWGTNVIYTYENFIISNVY